LVATFLAVLELAKTKKISIEGDMQNPSVQIIKEQG
jgi:chromatin segregation and condensation protein Rec8/ScpA/Scc1 (kleisin family)